MTLAASDSNYNMPSSQDSEIGQKASFLPDGPLPDGNRQSRGAVSLRSAFHGETDFEAVSPEVVAPFVNILENYGQCLDMSRDYVADNSDVSEEDLDLDLLEGFLNARADLFKVAESSFAAISAPHFAGEPEEAARRQMTRKVVTLLEEMTLVEAQLSEFLGDRLEKMRSTISQMQKTQPVFKRYGHLGGSKMVPSRINRHG